MAAPAPSSPDTSARPHRAAPLPGPFFGLLLLVVLYFGKPVLMPLALAVLFAFLLNPLVNGLHRLRLPRAVAVVLVTLSVFSSIGVLAWVIGREFSSLAASLPNYKDNIRDRIISIHQTGRGGMIENLQDIRTTIEESTAAASAPKPPPPGAASAAVPAKAAAPGPSLAKPLPAVEAEQSPSWLNGVLGSAGEALGTAATVIVFVIFMLLRQQELRNRLMRLAGFRHLTTVTRAMDETGGRVGRYLLMQALINGIYGIVLAVGLYFTGLPYVVLWGVLAALFRFVPYVGPVAVAVLPATLSLAVFPDWQHPLMVVALIAGLELLTNMILEPVLYGQSVGVSEFALLVAIVFWTWLWGGPGLVMATPLTVCFVVMARHVPSLEWVEILMGDHPPVKPCMVLYQRLLAGDGTEAGDFLDAELRKKSRTEVMDETILPAIAMTKREARQQRLNETEEQLLHEGVLQVVTSAFPAVEPTEEGTSGQPLRPARPLVLGWALDGAADAAALHCLGLLLLPELQFEILPAHLLTGEILAELEARQPAALIISAIPPGSHDTVRLQLRRLRKPFPRLRIFIGRWGVPEDIARAEPLREGGATAVFTGLAEAEKPSRFWSARPPRSIRTRRKSVPGRWAAQLDAPQHKVMAVGNDLTSS